MKKIKVLITEVKMRITKSNPTGASNNLHTTKREWTQIGYVYQKHDFEIDK